GQPHGEMYQLALRSRAIWLDLLERTGLPFRPHGSLHVLYREDEADVAREFTDLAPGLGFECEWLDSEAVQSRTAAARPEGLRGAIFSPTEVTVDPPRTIATLTAYLTEQYQVSFRFQCAITEIDLPCIRTTVERWSVSRAIVCSGADFE